MAPVRCTGDGALGHPAGAPYERVHITAGVRRVPAAWIEQVGDSATIVMPWGTDYTPHDQILRLTKTEPGRACGPFVLPSSFIKLRDQRHGYPETSFPDDWTDNARESTPDIDIGDITGGAYDPVQFVIGLHVPNCVPDPVPGTLWLYAPDMGAGPSIAAATFADGYKSAAYEAGPRDLWTEVQAAYHRWTNAGQPPAHAFGLTVTVADDGTVCQRPWFKSPDNELHAPWKSPQ
ncbi:hypothetical protein [Embleya sp. NPDC005971]|uniref:hypothetical protein n=1 Tax=Embleya sp. NPDC005971 TaxID=3156724 RepID=UPI0034082A8F